MKTSVLDIQVPPELIAQKPLDKRDDSKLLLVGKNKVVCNGGTFKDIIHLLNKNDLLVFNNSKVVPARLEGHKLEDPSEKIVLLLLEDKLDMNIWTVLVEKGRLKAGEKAVFGAKSGEVSIFHCDKEMDKIGKREERLIQGSFLTDVDLDEIGSLPVPPYIHGYKGNMERYQTVYAKEKGSTAAPTAGLHFTPALLEDFKAKGVEMAEVTLHISIDTFMPILEDETDEHKIYTEYCEVPQDTQDKIKRCKQNGGRVICVGTTAMRTLEASEGLIYSGYTNLFIQPGYKFKVVDAMITNFHYPRSTNLLLVMAFAGQETIETAYKFAIEHKYRFYSFGDSMFIQP